MKKPFLFLFFLLIIVDQVIKKWAIQSSFFVTNDHYIFGIVPASRLAITCIILMFVLLLMWSGRKNLHRNWLGLCFIFSGLVSNLLDRFVWGGVVDYLAINYKSTDLFINLADILILLGFVIYVTRQIKENHNQVSGDIER